MTAGETAPLSKTKDTMKLAIIELEIQRDIYANNREVAECEHRTEDYDRYSKMIVSIEKAILVLKAVDQANAIG